MLRYIFFFIFFVLCCQSCKDDSGDNGVDTVSGLKNGIEWESDIYARRYQNNLPGIFIRIDKYLSAGQLIEGIGIHRIPISTGIYNLTNTTIGGLEDIPFAFYSITADGHVGGDNYLTLTSDEIEDYFEITEINEDIIKGNFQASFIKDTSLIGSTPFLDTIIFKNIQFETRILE